MEVSAGPAHKSAPVCPGCFRASLRSSHGDRALWVVEQSRNCLISQVHGTICRVRGGQGSTGGVLLSSRLSRL